MIQDLLQENRGVASAIIAGALLFFVSGMFISDDFRFAWGVGYAVGLLAVLTHFITNWMMQSVEDDRFIRKYYLGIFGRFLFILGIYVIVMTVTKIDQISFTLSFIISYIFHSVIDIILINKTIAKETYQNS